MSVSVHGGLILDTPVGVLAWEGERKEEREGRREGIGGEEWCEGGEEGEGGRERRREREREGEGESTYELTVVVALSSRSVKSQVRKKKNPSMQMRHGYDFKPVAE